MPHHPVHPQPVVTPVPLPSSGKFAFNDDFDGAAGTPPNQANWAYDVGPGSVVGGNNETETYTDSTQNAYQDGESHLVIAVTAAAAGGTNSARIKTMGKFTQQYGSWQASIAVDNTPGCWPAFWFLGARGDWPACGEADVMENYGSGFTEGTVWNTRASKSTVGRALTAVDQDFHTYQMDSSPSGINYFVDGVAYVQATPDAVSPWPFSDNGGVYAILNIAVNGTGTGGIKPAASALPVLMKVDFVRAWS
ncbi:MAG TPA: glycoside hydrolase family 16 protein [Trebonia sp.]